MIKVKSKDYRLTGVQQTVSGHTYYLGKASINNDIPVGTIIATIPYGLYADGFGDLPPEGVGLYGGYVTAISEVSGVRVVRVTRFYI